MPQLYIIAGLIAIFIIIIIWIRRGDIVVGTRKQQKIKTSVLVKTEDGIIEADAQKIRLSFMQIRESLVNSPASANPSNKKRIAELIESLRTFIKTYPDSAKAACRIVATDNQSNFMQTSVDPTFAYVKGYAAILETEELERNLIELQEPRALFNYLLQNFDQIIQLLGIQVCPDGVLDLEKLEQYLLEINERIDDLQKSYKKEVATAELKIPEKLKLRMPTDLQKKPFDFANDIDRTLDAHGESQGYAPYSEKNIWFKAKQMIEPFDSRPYLPRAKPQIHKLVGFEESIDKDLLGYKPPGHFIRSLNDHHEYYTVDVNACLGHYVPDEWYAKECSGDTRNMFAALDGNPFPMLDNWVVDNSTW